MCAALQGSRRTSLARGQHLVDEGDALLDGLARAAGVLDVEDLERVALAQAAVRQPGVDLVGFAAQAHHQHAAEVGMRGVAGERALQDLHAQALGVHAAAGAVRERDDAVHVGEGRQRFGMVLAREVVGDRAGGRGRAVHAGQDADVVARGDTAVGALDAHEGGFAPGGLGLHVGAEGVVAREVAPAVAHAEVVRVHVLAGRDRLAGEADDLVVAAHRLAGGDGARGDLVARGDQPPDGDVLDLGAAHELGARDQDVVLRMESDEGSHGMRARDGARRTAWATRAQAWGNR